MGIGMIILAGGVGSRMGKSTPKQYLLLGGKPIIVHVLEKIDALTDLDQVVITCPAEHLDETRELLRHRNFGTSFDCIEGGETRQASVMNGLSALKDCETVIIHEAVRPFVSVDEFRHLIDSECENAIYGIPIPFTVLVGNERVEGNLERTELVNVQLPQKFDAAKLREGHEKALAEGLSFTEDASLFLHYGLGTVRILEGSELNIKITHPSDLVIGEALYAEYILGKA